MATIIIIGVVLLIAFALINNIVGTVRKRTCFLNTKSMEKAALNYVVFENKKLPKSSSINIPLEELRSKKYITEVLDPTDLKTNCEGYVTITEENGNYKTEGHLVCPTYCNSDDYIDDNSDEQRHGKYYAGENPNNWVLFGRYDQSSVYGILWRIIKTDDGGIKLVFEGLENGGDIPLEDGRTFHSATTGIQYDEDGKNFFQSSSLNLRLNNWLDSLVVTDKYKYIKNTNWKIGGIPNYNPTSKDIFINSEGIDSETNYGKFSGLSDLSGIALLNPSDFMSTSSNEACINSYKSGGSYNPCAFSNGEKNNFLHKNKYHFWTMNASSDTSNKAWYINNVGQITTGFTNSSVISVRPVINLDKNVNFLSGSGTIDDPYILEEYMINIKNSPIITLNEQEIIVVREDEQYIEYGATAYDPEDGDITDKIVITSNINTTIPGHYEVKYDVQDSDGNNAPTAIRKVIVSPKESPIITLNGSNPLRITLKSQYEELGAKAIDPFYGDISSDIEITGSVNTDELGVYEITYTVINKDNVIATPVVRKVIVEPPRPELVLNGDNPTNVYVGRTYEELGATAIDDVDGDITYLIESSITRYETIKTGDSYITRKSEVETVVVDKKYRYAILYKVTNSFGVTVSKIRNVYILPDDGPIINFDPDRDLTSKQVHSTKITVEKNKYDINPNSLKYMWIHEDWRMPENTTLESLIRTNFVNGSTIKRGGSTGLYKLYAIAKDVYGNTTIKSTGYFRVDNSKPALWLNGGNPQRILIDNPYKELGATAYDEFYSGNITSRIKIDSSSVNTNVAGIYSVKYSVKDDALNETIRNRKVDVYLSKPIITLNGSINEKVILGREYIEKGARAIDEKDGDISHLIEISGSVDTAKVGIYPITYTVTNSLGVTSKLVRKVEVYIPEPVITINGDNPLSHRILLPYKELGATAYDEIDGDITDQIKIVSNVNVSIKGLYEVEYTVTNSNKKTTTVTRKIDVYIPVPEITLNGPEFIKLYRNDIYEELGANAIDEIDGDITDKINLTGSVNPSKVGTYKLIYEVVNSLGEKSSKIRTVQVVEPSVEINLLGKNPYEMYIGDKYIEPGFVAIHEVLGDVTDKVIVNSKVNPNIEGHYKIEYSFFDRSVEKITTVSRSVRVLPPEINLTLNGDSLIFIPVGNAYKELGAIAIDAKDGDISHLIKITTDLNTNIVGEYNAEYTVTSNYGVSRKITRKIYVVALEGPYIKFQPNGDAVYKQNNSVTVIIEKNIGEIDLSSLKYLWSSKLDVPSEDVFVNVFNNSEIIKTPTDVNGPYYLWVLAKDVLGNVTIQASNRFLLDNKPPVISLKGSNIIELPVDGVYRELGATVIEEHSGLNDDGLVITSNLVPGMLGTYTITYDATDKAGLKAKTVTRTVNVVEASLKDAPGDGYVQKYYAEYFVGENPNNWVEFGNVADSDYDYVPILWRIIKADDNGIKIVYEGTKNEQNKKPIENGKVATGIFSNINNNYDTSTIRMFLDNWYINLQEPSKDKLVKKINWCVGSINSPYEIENFKNDECTVRTATESAIGLLYSGDYLLTSETACSAYNQASCGTSNFLRKDYDYMTLNGDKTNDNYIFGVETTGALRRSSNDKIQGIRPVINLKPNVLILGGNGTLANPYKLNTRETIIDNKPPIVKFTPESSTGYIQDRSIEVIVTDDITGVDPNTLKYVWTKSSTQPSIELITNNFVNGQKIELPTEESTNYYLWVLAKDRKGNQTITSGGPYLADNTAPIITINGSTEIFHKLGNKYIDLGATAVDNIDGPVAVKVETNLNINIRGTYEIIYKATDKSGNTAIAKRTVIVNLIEIRTPEDLYNVRNNIYSDYIIVNDIDISSSKYANSFPVIEDFYGTIDGNNKKIIGLNINEEGLFKNLHSGVELYDFKLVDFSNTSSTLSNVGSLTGIINSDGIKISGVEITGNSIIHGNNYVGGIFGKNTRHINIKNISVKAAIKGVDYVGGLVGYSSTIDIDNSSSSSVVNGNNNVGGLLGYSSNSGTKITNSYVTGDVRGNRYNVGGLAGYVSSVNISMCYASGNVRGMDNVGGFIGYSNGGTIEKSYASGNVESTTTSSNTAYGTGGFIGRNHSTLQDVFEIGDVTRIGTVGYISGLVGLNYGNISRAYVGGKLTNANVFIDRYQSGTMTNTYWIGETTGKYSGSYAKLISSVQEATNSSNYVGFDFDNVWGIEYGETTPYIKGLAIPEKIYINQ